MKRLALIALFVALPAIAATGILVSQDVANIGGQTVLVCTYNVNGSRVQQIVPLGGMCPLTIEF